MISKTLLWIIALSVLGLLAVSWWGSTLPARVVIINQAGTLRDVSVSIGDETLQIGELRRGESRAFSLRARGTVRLVYTASSRRTWQSHEQLRAGQSMVLTIRPNERVAVANR